MNTDVMNELVDFIDDNVKKFSARFNDLKVNFNQKFKNECNILYERTLSNEANNYISVFLSNKYKNNFRIGLSEFNVKPIENLFDNVDVFVNEVGKTSKKEWEECYFDGFFQVDNFILQGENNIFVEYKLNSKFKYIDLATDYLKFKIFTKHCDNNKIFVFIIFDKNINYPTILYENNKVCILNKVISEEKLVKSRVFLYIPSKNSGIKEDTISLYKELNQISKLSTSVIDYTNELRYSELEALFMKNLGKFNANVIKATYIRENFTFIETLWDTIQTNYKDDPIYDEWKFDDYSLDNVRNILKGPGYHMHNVEQKMHKNDVIDSKKKGLNVGNRSSFNIIVFLDFFNKKFEIVNGLKPIYFTENYGKGKNLEVIEDSKTAKNHINELFDWYSDEKYALNAKKLGFQYLYVIHNVYRIIFDINSDNKVLCESDKYIFNQSVDKMQEHFKKINKILKVKNVVDPYSDDYSSQSAELLNYIISNY